MIILALEWLFCVAGMIALALRVPGNAAIGYWAAVVAVLAGAAALALRSQPIGKATFVGRLGSAILRWGFRAGQGRLWPAVVISWLVWVVLGAAVITALHSMGDIGYQLLVLAWLVDVLALCYILGLLLARRGGSRSFLASQLTVAATLLGMIVVSAVLSRTTDPGAQRLALGVAGGPPLFIGGGYGLFLLVMMTVGRKARWN